EFTRKEQKLKLEDMYHNYCNQIHESPRKMNSEGKVNRENNFGKPDVDAKLDEENRQKKDNKGKCRMNSNTQVANLPLKTLNGSSEAKIHSSEINFRISEKSKDSDMEAEDDISGHTNRKNSEKAYKNSEPAIRTHKGSTKHSNASNKFEHVFDYAEPMYKSKKSKGEKKKRKATSDEMNVTDNVEQNGGKKSKKVTTLEKEVQSMKCHALHGEAKKGRTPDLRQDIENTTNIEVSKKEKKKKKTKLVDTSPGDDGELGATGVEITSALRKSWTTGSNTKKRKLDIESVHDLSEDPSTSPNLEVSEEMKKSSRIPYDNKNNKKEKKVLKTLQVTLSHAINGVKGVEGSLSKEHISPKTKEDKQKKLEMPTPASAFRRVRVEEVNFVDPMLGDNSYWAKDGAENGYGAKAQQVLGQVRG
ncbi:hypothetical protein KI387_011695, partial [Taxus chinensis]